MNKSHKSWTGERLETFISDDTTIEHLHRYGIAQQLCTGKIVLDIASGEGYGSNLLADYANYVYGVDISENAVKLATEKYKRKNLFFQTGSCGEIPLEDNCVDIVISFETIEHHDKHDAMLKEIKRVLKSDGIILISSPDKKYYSDIPKYNNPYHIKELYYQEFRDLMKLNFRNCGFYFQKIINGSIIIPDSAVKDYSEYTGDYSKINTNNQFNGVYNLCVASDANIPALNMSAFISENIVKQAIDDTVKKIQSSKSYKVGNFFISPIAYLIRRFKGSKHV